MSNKGKYRLLSAVGTVFCVAPPLVATFLQFPVWVQRSASTVSGVALVLILFSALPFLKQIKEYMKSPSVTVLWIVAFVFVYIMRNIIDQMFIVCFAGLCGNALGSVMFAWRKKYNEALNGNKEN